MLSYASDDQPKYSGFRYVFGPTLSLGVPTVMSRIIELERTGTVVDGDATAGCVGGELLMIPLVEGELIDDFTCRPLEDGAPIVTGATGAEAPL